MKKPKTNKGFTLVELLVVMTIIGAMMMLGVVGLSTFRRMQQLQAEAENLKEYLRSARSSAYTGGVEYQESDDNTWIYGFMVKFESGSYSLYRLDGGGSIPPDTGAGSIESYWVGDWETDESNLVDSYDIPGDFVVEADCEAVGFASVSGQTSLAASTDPERCTITLTLGSRSRTVEVLTNSGDILIGQP